MNTWSYGCTFDCYIIPAKKRKKSQSDIRRPQLVREVCLTQKQGKLLHFPWDLKKDDIQNINKFSLFKFTIFKTKPYTFRTHNSLSRLYKPIYLLLRILSFLLSSNLTSF